MRIWKSTAITVAVIAAAAVIYEKVVYGQQAAPSQQTASQAGNPPTKAAAPRQASRRGHDGGIINAARLSPEVVKARQDAMAPSEALRLQGQALYEAGDLAGAEQADLKALDAAPVFGYMKPSEPLIARQLGQAYLKDGKYDQAIHWLGGAKKTLTTVGGGLDLDLALAYIRMGDYANASRHYSDQAIMQYHSGGKNVLLQDLPGTDTPQALEASILLARGQDAYSEYRHDAALEDFQAAARLAPNNVLIAYDCAEILNEKRRLTEAVPF